MLDVNDVMLCYVILHDVTLRHDNGSMVEKVSRLMLRCGLVYALRSCTPVVVGASRAHTNMFSVFDRRVEDNGR